MIALIILDFLVANLSEYSTHFIILGIPYLQDYGVLITYFLLLSFFDFRYLYNLGILLVIKEFDKYLSRYLQNTILSYLLRVTLYLALYIVFIHISLKVETLIFD